MKSKRILQKSRIGVSFFLIVTLLLSLASSVFAHNVAAVVKAVNVLGYQYVNQNTIKVFFDKGIYVNQGQYRIQTEGGTPVTISSVSASGGSGWTNPNSPGGTTVTITTGSNLSPNTRYKVIVSSTIQMGNSYHLTVGNYLLHKDVEFYFKTPNTNGEYSGTPQLQVIPSGEHVGVSENIVAISDIPIDTTSFNLSDIYLQKSTDGETYSDVIVDTTFDGVEDSGAECYLTQINDVHTTLFIPMTLGGQASAVHNLSSYDTQYRLVVPPNIEDLEDERFFNDSVNHYYLFKTGYDTSASLGNITPTFTGHTSSSVSLSWSDVATDASGPAPVHYNVYYSTNPYFDFVKSSNPVDDSGATNTSTVTGLTQGQTYYFRIVPINDANEEGGFSPYASQVTN